MAMVADGSSALTIFEIDGGIIHSRRFGGTGIVSVRVWHRRDASDTQVHRLATAMRPTIIERPRFASK
jgi:hypothetical protein